jgi:hypothetical protein
VPGAPVWLGSFGVSLVAGGASPVDDDGEMPQAALTKKDAVSPKRRRRFIRRERVQAACLERERRNAAFRARRWTA